MICFGLFDRVMARCRSVLKEYNMSCDEVSLCLSWLMLSVCALWML